MLISRREAITGDERCSAHQALHEAGHLHRLGINLFAYRRFSRSLQTPQYIDIIARYAGGAVHI